MVSICVLAMVRALSFIPTSLAMWCVAMHCDYDLQLWANNNYALFITDIDECSKGTHQCTQNCNNTIGSYICSCDDGFIIDIDRRTCDGEYFITILHVQ